jgi:hypothetical protein
MAKVISLTHERLTQVLGYDPASGVFTWKVRPSNRIHVGDQAGVIVGNGHRYIMVDGEKLQASRLAWFYVHRIWPAGDIKFRNGNTADCWIENLRDVDRVSGARERGLVSNNSTGFKGVSPAPFGKFQSKITWNYKQISLGGNFESAELASAAYVDAETRLTGAADVDAVIRELLLEKRQRAAWSNLVNQGIVVGWTSFEEFAAEAKDVPERRYALASIDSSRPVGPGNYRWSSEDHPVAKGVDGKRAYAKANRGINKDQLRDRDFRKKYGIDFAEYQRMLIDQKGVCASCERPETRLTDAGELRMLSVDHNHTTSAVRGLLCSNCNLVLGYACDDVSVLQSAIAYLRKHAADDTVLKFEPTRPNRDWLFVATPGFGDQAA